MEVPVAHQLHANGNPRVLIFMTVPQYASFTTSLCQPLRLGCWTWSLLRMFSDEALIRWAWSLLARSHDVE